MQEKKKRVTAIHSSHPRWFSDMSDEELLREYQLTGNDDLFGEIVERHRKGLVNHLRRFLGNEALVEDVYQTTFLNVHRNLDQFETGRRFKPWLFKIATNRAIDATRRNRVRRMASLDAPRQSNDQEGCCSYGDLLVDRHDGPLTRLEQRERQAWVRLTVLQLPERLRVIVHLIVFRGMKYREAAVHLSLPVGTVKSRMHAAVNEMKKAWAARGEN